MAIPRSTGIFLLAFAVPIQFAVKAASNKRTGRFSFCGLLLRSLFSAGFSFSRRRRQRWERALPFGYVPFLKYYPPQKKSSGELSSFSHGTSPIGAPLPSDSTNSEIIILSISKVYCHCERISSDERYLVY